jgi:ribonuclease P protein component
MIAKKHRIEREKIAYILKKGKSYKSSLFIVRYKKNNRGIHRFAVIISKKISAKAVIRNRFKRQIYEAIRNKLKTTEIKENLDIIIIPKKTTKEYDYQEIEKDIESILQLNE